MCVGLLNMVSNVRRVVFFYIIENNHISLMNGSLSIFSLKNKSVRRTEEEGEEEANKNIKIKENSLLV